MRRHSDHRAAIEQVLVRALGPLSADEVRQNLLKTGIGIATVYRLLKQGVDDGIYSPVEMPNGPTRYEPAARPHHHHFECQICRRVYDIMGCPGQMDRFVPDDFSLESHELLLYGRCASCLKTDAA